MRRIRTTLAAMLVAAGPALGQPPPVPEELQRVPVEPPAALAAIRAAYHDRAVSEEVEVRLRTATQDRRERIGLVLLPGPRFSLELGKTIAWFDAGALHIVHSLDERAYFSVDGGSRDPISLVEATLPPLPLPQLWLALTPPDQEIRTLTPYARSMTWTSAEVIGAEREQIVIIQGEADRARVEVEADAKSGRLKRASFTLDDGAVRIDLAMTPRAIEPTASVARDLSHRDRVMSVEELRPRTGDLRVGDVLPEIILPGALEADGVAQVKGPGVIVFFRRWGTPAASAVAAARRVVEADPRLALWPVFVIDPTEARALLRTVEVHDSFGAGSLYKSLSPPTTIDRFGEGALCIAVAVDSRGVIRFIEALERGSAAAPGAAAHDLTAKADEPAVERLAGALRTALAD